MLSLILALTTATFPLSHSFGGYDCQNDCAMLAAGYSWAAEHGVLLLGTCAGIKNNSDFQNGCFTYLGDPFRGSTQDDQGLDIDQ